MSFSHEYLEPYTTRHYGVLIKGADFFKECIRKIERAARVCHVGTAVIDTDRHERKDKRSIMDGVPLHHAFIRHTSMVFTPYSHAYLLMVTCVEEIVTDRTLSQPGKPVGERCDSYWSIQTVLGLKEMVWWGTPSGWPYLAKKDEGRSDDLIVVVDDHDDGSEFHYRPVVNGCIQRKSGPANADGTLQDVVHRTTVGLGDEANTANISRAVAQLTELTEDHARRGKLGRTGILSGFPPTDMFPLCCENFWAQIGLRKIQDLFTKVDSYVFLNKD